MQTTPGILQVKNIPKDPFSPRLLNLLALALPKFSSQHLILFFSALRILCDHKAFVPVGGGISIVVRTHWVSWVSTKEGKQTKQRVRLLFTLRSCILPADTQRASGVRVEYSPYYGGPY